MFFSCNRYSYILLGYVNNTGGEYSTILGCAFNLPLKNVMNLFMLYHILYAPRYRVVVNTS